MFNVTVLKMKDIKKYVFFFLIAFSLIIIICKYLPKEKEKNKINKIILNVNMTSCLEQESSVIKKISKDNNENEEKEAGKDIDNKTRILQKILETQVSSINGINSNSSMENSERETNQEKQENQNNDNENGENNNDNIDSENEGQNKEENQQNQETSSDIDEAKVRS